jgi:ABC transport system ATP-binding/permease protein
MQRLERQIERLSAREAELSAELAAHTSDYQKPVEMGEQLRAVQEEKARLEDRRLTVAGEF